MAVAVGPAEKTPLNKAVRTIIEQRSINGSSMRLWRASAMISRMPFPLARAAMNRNAATLIIAAILQVRLRRLPLHKTSKTPNPRPNIAMNSGGYWSGARKDHPRNIPTNTTAIIARFDQAICQCRYFMPRNSILNWLSADEIFAVTYESYLRSHNIWTVVITMAVMKKRGKANVR